MKARPISSWFILGGFFLQGCFGYQSYPPFWFQHLEGSWKAKTNDGMFIENWKSTNDSTFIGSGYLISFTKDTVFSENLAIVKTTVNTWGYNVNLSNAREYRSISFAEKVARNKTLWFSHPSNEFPSSIRYRFLTKNRLHVALFPRKGEKESIQRLRFCKVLN